MVSRQNYRGTGEDTTCRRRQAGRRWLLPATGFLALAWFLVRVVPKPSRAAYPCQQPAAPLAAGFVAWVVGVAGSAMLFHKARSLLRASRWATAGLCLVAAGVVWWSGSSTSESVSCGVFTPSDGANRPLGVARGIHPGRVVWVHDRAATSWDGVNGYWSAHVDKPVVSAMCSTAVRWLSGADTDDAAWDLLFRSFKQRHGKAGEGYLPGEKIAIKVNMVQCGTARHSLHPGNSAYNAPQLVYAVLRQLVDHGGVEPADITVYDASNYLPNTLFDLCSSGDLHAVRFVDVAGGDGRVKAEPDFAAPLFHADPFVPTRGLPRCVSEADYVVNLAHLKGHYLTGVTLCAKNHFGSTWVESGARFWPGESIHQRINAYAVALGQEWLTMDARPMGSYNPLVELMGHTDLGEKTVLFLVDGLYAAVHQNESMEHSPMWLSAPFNGDWPSSLFASQDGVAIDSVALDFLRSEPTQTYVADALGHSTADDYLHEAARADDPPSGTFYDPGNTGQRLPSLGVHEHWSNAVDKEYSRNLGTGDGIELYTGPAISWRSQRGVRRWRP